jgi:hypothetical protein
MFSHTNTLLMIYSYIRHAVSPMHFSERSYYVFGDQTTFITQNGTQGQGTLFTVDEERDGDFDSVSEYERDYAPMTFAPHQQQLPSSAASAASSQQPPGLTFGISNSNNVLLHSHQPKIYSNVGIGGPASDMLHHQPSNNGNYHHSSSSSNVTSNSTSTTSQNTTATTSTSALGKN